MTASMWPYQLESVILAWLTLPVVNVKKVHLVRLQKSAETELAGQLGSKYIVHKRHKMGMVIRKRHIMLGKIKLNLKGKQNYSISWVL